ncbi:MAG: tetratricopeptide repeat protein, partial [Thiohalocapsa sp.]
MAYHDGRAADTAQMLTRVLRLDALHAKVLSLLARFYRQRKKWAEAASVLARLDALQPGARTKRLLADALLSDGQFEAAARVYEELAALLPDNPRILQRLARAHSRRRDWNAACLAYERLVTRGWLRPVDRLGYGRALYEAGNTGEAEIQLQAVLRDKPDERDALTWLARIRSRNDPEQAYAYWGRLAELKPKAVEPPLQMARIRVRQRRLAEARRLFETVLALNGDHEEALAGIGHALAETDRTAAIAHFTRWAARSQRNLAPRFELARLYQRAHERDLAEAIYREVLERDPHNQRAMSHLAELLSRDHSRLDHALDLWRQIGERDRRAHYPIVQRALLYERVRRFEEAEAEYRRALARAPGDAGVTIGLARLLSNSGQLAEAAELFEAVTRANPRRVDALLSLGRCLERLGRDEEALGVYQRVLFVEPANPNAPLYRGRLLRRLGRLDEAI